MDFAQSFYNQSSFLSINLMVVDDDPVFLQVMSRMLEKSKYRDPSIMEIRVIAVKDSMEALSTLKVERNNIDLIITDYYMPVMNGLQLKSEITRQFGNVPIIVMSSDNNKEHESLICGALCFIPKPIKPIDLTKIYQLALTCKRNGKSILWTDHNHMEKDISVPKQIDQLLPEQPDDVLKTKEKNCLSASDSRSLSITNETCVISTDGSRENLKRKSNVSSGDHDEISKKKNICWTDFLNDRFLQAINHIGIHKAVPKNILEFMNVSYLTRAHVASHLQKYRIFLRKVVDEGVNHTNAWSSGRDIESKLQYGRFKESYNNYFKPYNSWYETSLNDRSFYSKPMHGFGQSRLLSNTREPVRVNQTPYSYLNRSSTNEPRPSGSNLMLPMKNKLNFSNQPCQNEGRRTEPLMMANNNIQTSDVLGFGQHGLSASNGNMRNFFGSSTLNQSGILNNNESSTFTRSGVNNYGSSNLNRAGLNNNGSSTLNRAGLNNYGSSTPNRSELNNYESSILNRPGPNNYESSTFNRPQLSNNGSLTSNQPGLNNYYGTPTLYQPGQNIFGSSTPNLEIPQLENLSICDDLSKNNEFPCNTSNIHVNQNKQQGEATSTTTNFDLPANFSTELDQIFSNGEMSNTFAAPETNSTIFNPNQNQEQDVPDFLDWSFLDSQNLVDDDFMGLFKNDMN